MAWAALIPIIIQYGLPVAESIFQKFTSGAVPTQADFDQLNQLTIQNAKAQMTKQLTAAGVPLTDPHAVDLLALTS